jgi:hypothetical protein
MDVWSRISQFLTMAKKRKLSEKSIAKMMEAWTRRHVLEAEMHFCLAMGKLFHDAGFELEGDGFCCAVARRHLAAVNELVQEVARDKSGHRIIVDVVTAAHARGVVRNDTDMLTSSLATVAANVVEQFSKAIMTKMAIQMPLYHAAGLFDPLRFMFETRQIHWAEKRVEWFDYFVNLKGVRNAAAVRVGLDNEYLTYQRAVREYNTQLSDFPDLQKPKELWMWRLQYLTLTSFFEIACVLILMQPSSASVERFFSLLKANSSRQQNRESRQTLALRSMCLYNYE